MSTWLTAWRNREDHEPIGPVMELLVLAGADAGSQFTIEGNEVLVGRGQPVSGQTDVIRLDDKSISRRQAWIRRDSTGTSIEHIPTSGNPTFVNGAEISRARLSVGDRIEMGRVAIDVRARIGMNLSDLTQIMEGAARESTITGAPLDKRTDVGDSGASPVRTAPPISSSVARVENVKLSALGLVEDVTEVRSVEVELGELRVSRGPD
ncbi:MAG: FHA domain-containing protein, partial [bacterium]